MRKVWVLTEEYNDYDQHGAYFLGVFLNKPTKEQLQEYGVSDNEVDHVLNGGGRTGKWEGQWFNLEQVDAG